MHVSLDGFVATPKGELNWVKLEEEIFDYIHSKISETDTALYGRNTYKIMQDYWPTAADSPTASRHDIDHSKWYMRVHKIILSKTMQGASLPGTTIVSENISAEINKFKQSEGGDIIIFGSPGASHSLTGLNLIDEYWLFINPVVLGQGISLFKDIKDKMKLSLLSSKVFPSGVVCLHYGIVK